MKFFFPLCKLLQHLNDKTNEKEECKHKKPHVDSQQQSETAIEKNGDVKSSEENDEPGGKCEIFE